MKLLKEFKELFGDSVDEKAIRELRVMVRNRLLSQDNFLKNIPDEIEDMVRVSRLFGVDFLSMPRWLCLYYPEVCAFSVSKSLYTEIAKLHKQKVEKLLLSIRPRTFYVPPLLSIVLSKCKTRDDFLEALWCVREDFTEFRIASCNLEHRMINGETLKDQLDALDEFQNAIDQLSAKVKEPKQRLLQAIWEVFKDPGLLKTPYQALDKLFKQDIKNQRLNRVEGFYDLWSSSMRISDYANSLARVFGEGYHQEEDPLGTALQYVEQIVKPIRRH